jgi:hypothetical protein
MSPPSNGKESCRLGFGAWATSFVIGVIALPVAAWILLPAVFGVQRADSSAVWGLAGAAPLLLAILFSPLFAVVHVIAFMLLKYRVRQPFYAVVATRLL